MDSPFHPFSELFAQLGLPSDAQSMEALLDRHAPFWSPSQATLLREELLEDGDWSSVVEQLNEALRH